MSFNLIGAPLLRQFIGCVRVINCRQIAPTDLVGFSRKCCGLLALFVYTFLRRRLMTSSALKMRY
ncbi:Uncharacterized protein APZ42_026694 [Daphnia magna]|uniref:Uncharacterized protein n=1 Tax=Daphnia magna TaxID=35525 RepID=A0A0P6CDE5_9CRUS|nr:Uncharacterized protein APZ42_026694 [Daphnia magna]